MGCFAKGNLLRMKWEGGWPYNFSAKLLAFLTELFQTMFHFLQVFEDVGIEVKLMRVWQGFLNHALEFIHVHVVVSDKKKQALP